MPGGISTKEIKAYARRFEDKKKSFKPFVKKFLKEQGYVVMDDAVLTTPVDTGALRANWQISEVSEDVAGNLAVDIENGMEYASHVEYGHATRGGGSFVQGRFMLTRAMARVVDDMPDKFSKRVSKFLKDDGL